MCESVQGDKGKILDKVVAATGLVRSSAWKLLACPTLPGQENQVDLRKLRPKGFGNEVRALLERLWVTRPSGDSPTPGTAALSSATERKLERLAARITALHDQMATHDQSDYTAVNRLWDDLRQAEAETATLEERWLELSEGA
ncbi:MAG: hypothetical protein LBI99_04785 [Propionibacteriaceae bacterium]|nr:hypothetical protein [Propionibacteriaceae bacterium]